MACGLALDDEGFDFSVLTYWRTRLRKSEHPERIFDAVRSVIDATGVLKGKTRRALDSTLLDDAVATQDTVTQLIAAIRRVRRVVPGAEDVVLSAHDYEMSGQAIDRLGRFGGQGGTGRWTGRRRPGSVGRLRARRKIPRPPLPWDCWLWSPAKTSNKVTTAPGRSPRK